MSTFKQSIQDRSQRDIWNMDIILVSGIHITVSSEYIIFHEDFLEFDRIVAEVAIPGISNSGTIPRLVKIPYNAIEIFTDQSS